MEKLEDVLMRLHNISREEAREKVSRAKYLIESGKSAEEVLVNEYGVDTEYLEEVLTPKILTDAAE